MKRVLGIDLGTNSLGWAIIEDNKIIACGVLIFDQGIPLVKGIEAANSPSCRKDTLPCCSPFEIPPAFTQISHLENSA